ncbi:MAG: gliding motility-associated C-terminal domain-containing protein [Flavobacteriales bacterium]
MSDQLIELLRERFHGHEMDVPPGAWEQVTGQMAANSEAGLRESLQDKFQGHEVHVDPSAWVNINAQIGTGAAAGTSVYTSWIAAGVAAVVITAGLFIWSNKEATTVVSIPEASQISLNEVPALEAKPVAVNPEPEMEAPAPKTTAAEVTPARTIVPKATVQAEGNHAGTAQEPTPQTDAADQVVPSEPQQKPEIQTPVRHPIAPFTVDPKAGQEPTHERAPVTPTDGSASDTRMETKNEPTQEPSDPIVDNDQSILDDPFQTNRANDILIPNAFSPQGDGVNDKLKIVAGEYEKVDVRVFAAKTGSLVFRSNDLSNMWDGRLPNGNIAEEGYYSCMVLLTDKNGQTRVKSMVVQLFR